MQPLTTIEQLIVARDHGIPVPPITIAADAAVVDAAKFHYTDCDPSEVRVAVELEDYPNTFYPLANCSDCYNISQSADEGRTNRALLALDYNSAEASRFADVSRTFSRLTPASPRTFNNEALRDNRHEFLRDYARLAQRLQRRPGPGGDTVLGLTMQLYPCPEGNLLVEYVLECLEDLVRQASRLLGGRPLAAFLAPEGGVAAKRQFRAVLHYDESPAVGGVKLEEHALVGERATLLELKNGWRLVEWSSSLAEWTHPGSTIDIDDLAGTPTTDVARSLEQALHVYSQTTEPADFHDLVTAILAAHAT